MGFGAVVWWFFSWRQYSWGLYDRRKKHYDDLEEARKLLQQGKNCDIGKLDKLRSESRKLFTDKKIESLEEAFYEKVGELRECPNTLLTGLDPEMCKKRSELMLYFTTLDLPNYFNKYLDIKPPLRKRGTK
jgi:hypothetical protein